MATSFSNNSYWTDKSVYDDAEKRYYEKLSKLIASKLHIGGNIEGNEKSKKNHKTKSKNLKNQGKVNTICMNWDLPAVVNGTEKMGSKKEKGNTVGGGAGSQLKSSLASEVAKAREHIKTSLESVSGLAGNPTSNAVETKCGSGTCGSKALAETLAAVKGLVQSLEKRVAALEVKCAACPPVKTASSQAASVKPKAEKAVSKADDDDVDLFGSDSEEENDDAKAAKEKLLADYAAKKSKKPALIAKSSIILDVKPWDDETDMKQLEAAVREIEMDGLLWGASKLVPLAYGIHKLQINCIVEDEKVSVDLLTENIQEISELVQSVDIAAFNKI